jgi:hypothetical protein
VISSSNHETLHTKNISRKGVPFTMSESTWLNGEIESKIR